MISVNETGVDAGRFLFIAHETLVPGTAGVSRYDHATNTHVNLGFNADWGTFDPSTWTSWGSVITGEEGRFDKGRLFEVTNPLDDPTTTINFVERAAIPNVSHEGMKFDSLGNFYFVDEFNGGAIYKFAPSNPNSPSALAQGQSFVLKDTNGTDGANVGSAVWEPISDALGNPLSGVTDPFTITSNTRPGRAAANDVGASDYFRPEDLEIGTLANGNEVLYVATTSTHQVFSIELSNNSNSPFVREFVNLSTIDAATGLGVGRTLDNPDNLAIDANGNIYIVEDSNSGDIWFAEDTDNDGVAESIARWASLGVVGAEPSGLFFDPFNPSVAYVNVMHPSSGNDNLIQISIPEPASLLLALAACLAFPLFNQRSRKRYQEVLG